jgi:Mrp family chromosome partitioning ATPase
VAGAGETSRPALIRARQLLDQARASVAGVVLNKLDPGRHGRYYDSYYYYYYHHDSDELGGKRKKRRSLPALASSLFKKQLQHRSDAHHHDIET